MGLFRCQSCETLKELLRESEKRNKELTAMIKTMVDSANDRNHDLTETITGKNVQYQPTMRPNSPTPLTHTARRKKMEQQSRELAQQRIRDTEAAAGIILTPKENISEAG